MNPRPRALRLLVGIIAVAALAFTAAAQATDWPQFHNDAARTGFNSGEVTLDASNVSGLSVRWSTAIGGVVISPAVVAGGKVFAGSDDGNLYALDSETGAVLWKGQTGASIVLTPAVDGSRVYVGSEDANFYAFPVSCSTPCAPLWTTALSGRPTSAPAVSGGVVYVGAGSGAGGELWALDGVSGAVLWRATQDIFTSPRGVAVSNDVVLASGSPAAFPTSCTTPCAALWFGQFGGSAPLSVADGVVYADAGFVNNRFNAYPAQCTFLCFPSWIGATNGGSTRNVAAIAYGKVFFSEDSDTLSAFPTLCSFFCTPIWTVSTGGFLSSAAVANGVVYVGTDNGVRAFDATTGAALATVTTGDATLTPAIADGSLYVSTVGFANGGRVLRLAFPSTTIFLHGNGATANPPSLTLDSIAPTSITDKYSDSSAVKFSGGNLWKAVGTWKQISAGEPSTLQALGNLHVWLGLKNSDDQGTYFDLTAELYLNGRLVANGVTRAISGVTRNPSLAKEAVISFGAGPGAPINPGDVIELKLSTRIGTNLDNTKYAGHASATGLRVYYDSTGHPARFSETFAP